MFAVLKSPRFLAIAAVTLGLSCIPTDGCSCTPMFYTARVYGNAPGAVTAEAWDNARIDIARYAPCEAEPEWVFHEQFAVPASGTYSRQVISGFGNSEQCARITFFETTPGGSDSLTVGPFVVTFVRGGREGDSTHIALPP